MPRKAACTCGECRNCKARLAMSAKRAKERGQDADLDLEYLKELVEKAERKG